MRLLVAIIREYWEASQHLLLPAIAIVCILLGGCGGGGPAVKTPPVEKPPTEIATQPTTAEKRETKAAQADVDRLKGELAAAESKLLASQKAEREARLNGVRMLLTWLTAVLALAAVVAVVAAVWMRITSLYYLAGACLAGVVTAQSFAFVLDHIVVASCIVLGIGLVAVGLVLWKHRSVEKTLKKTEKAVVGAIQVAEYLKPFPADETEAEAEERKREQEKILKDAGPGVLDIIKSNLAKLQI